MKIVNILSLIAVAAILSGCASMNDWSWAGAQYPTYNYHHDRTIERTVRAGEKVRKYKHSRMHITRGSGYGSEVPFTDSTQQDKTMATQTAVEDTATHNLNSNTSNVQDKAERQSDTTQTPGS